MYLRRSQVVVLVFGLATSAATISSRSARIHECLATNVVSTETLEFGEETIHVKTVKCPDVLPLVGSGPKLSLQERSSLLSRSASECTKPAECQCGQTCSGQCANNGLPAPLIADCQKLQQLFSSGNGNKNFFLEPGTFSSTGLGTCQALVFNLRETEIEFCQDDWTTISLQLAQVCVPAGFDAGICEPANSAIAVEFAGPD